MIFSSTYHALEEYSDIKFRSHKEGKLIQVYIGEVRYRICNNLEEVGHVAIRHLVHTHSLDSAALILST